MTRIIEMRRLVYLVLMAALLAAAAAPARAAELSQGSVTHTVAWGETLSGIALQYSTSVEAICAANGIANPSTIYAGQQLTIPTADASATTGAGVHVVAPGENLYRIALQYGVTVQALAQLNGVADHDRILVGQTLRIPGGSTAPAAAQPLTPAAATHIVQPGETLVAIAMRYGVAAWALVQANAIANPALIFPGQVLTIPGAGGPATAPPPTIAGAKRIVVDLSEQHLYAYQSETLVYSFVASTGMAGSRTSPGAFSVLNKLPNAYASTWDLQMPYWLGIYWAGGLQNGIHALPILSNGQQLWAGYLGAPISYGCIVLGTYEASLLYQWAEVGTPVIVQY